MPLERLRITIYCRDETLRGYLKRVLEGYGELEVCPPSANGADATLIVDSCLTRRERECLQAIAECGEATRAAQQLGISVCTLNNKLAQIRAKLGVKTTLAAVVWAMRVGLVR